MPNTETVSLHPQYIRERDLLRKIEAFTIGTVELVRAFLWPYMTEDSQEADAVNNFANRKKRLYHINNCEPFIWIHQSHMAQPITLTGWEGPTFDAISADVSGETQNQQQFAEEVLWNYMRDGKVCILVDRPPEPAFNLLQARALNERSYQCIIESKHLIYWEKFPSRSKYRGLYRVVVFRDEDEVKDGKMYPTFLRYQIEEGASSFMIQRLRGRGEHVFTNTVSPSEEMEVAGDPVVVNLPVIPVAIMGGGVQDSFLHSIIENNEAHMNLGSCLSNVIYNQVFQRIIAAGVKAEELKRMGEWLVTTVSNEAARIFTIEAGNPEAAFREKAEVKNEIYRRGKFEFNQLADDTRQVQSAPSKERDSKSRERLYDQTLDQLSKILEKVWAFHAMFEGAKDARVSVTIARDYGLDDPETKNKSRDSAFAKAQILGAREVQKQILKTMLPTLDLNPNVETEDGEGETKDEMLERLYEDVDGAGPQLPPAAATNGGAPRPSVLDRILG